MLEKVLRTVKKYDMLKKGETVVIGLSGGADSVFLTFVLLKLKEIYGLTLSAVHINHGLRGSESERDENFAADFCAGLDIPFKAFRFDIKKEAAGRGMSVEEAGRLIRYDVFEKVISSLGGGKIAVAHNKNDSAETVILNICRGCGLSGLSGIPPVRGNIIRPMIDLSREEIEDGCRENGLSYVYDSTNLKLCYARNAVRLMIIPLIKEHINSDAVENIKNLSDIAKSEDDYLNALAREGYLNCLAGSRGLDIAKLIEYPEALQKRIIRTALREKFSLKNISRTHIEDILKLTSLNSGKTAHLPNDIKAERDFDLLTFTRKIKKNQDFYYDLVYNKTVYIKELNLYALASLEEIEGGKCFLLSGESARLAARNRRAGDKIYFSSINGHKKIKDFFIEQRIPRDERDEALIIASGSEVFWLRRGERDIFSGFKGGGDEGYEKIYVKVWKGTQ